jgi:small-conductance mechanosensitive channel
MLLVISAFGYVLAGVFVTAPPGRVQHPMHTVAFSTVFIPFGLASVVVGIRLLRVRDWRLFGLYSIVAGLVTIFAALGNLSSLFSPAPQTPLSSPASQQVFGGFGGLASRIVVVLALAWYVVIAARLLRKTNGSWTDRR